VTPAPAVTRTPAIAPAVPTVWELRWGLLGIGVVALAWGGALAAMVACDSNPVVLNRVQIAAADTVLQGTLAPGSKHKLQVTKDWKGRWSGAEITLAEPFPVAMPPGELLVPVTLTSPREGQITHGILNNFPDHTGLATRSDVLPLVYPANAETLAQLSALLAAPAAPTPSPKVTDRP